MDGVDHVVKDIDVARWIPHPRYDAGGPVNQLDDIALIELSDSASENPPTLDGEPQYSPRPIRLAVAPSTTAGDLGALLIAGFGLADGGTVEPFALWASGIPAVPARSCDHRINSAYQLCFATYPNTCAGDSGGPVFKQEGDGFVQYGIVSFGSAGPCGLIPRNSVATYTPAYARWVEEQIAVDPSDAIHLTWELPAAASGGEVSSGISNAQGWTFSTEGTIESVELFMDGRKEASLPCCSERGDVKAALPHAPLRSGFSAAVNWGRFPPGDHEMTLAVTDSQGNVRRETRMLRTVQIIPGISFLRDLSFRDADCRLDGDSGLICSHLAFGSGECSGEIRFRWSNGKQALEVSEGCQGD